MGSKIKHILTSVMIVAISCMGFLVTTGTASAAACSNGSNFGSATSTVNVPATGDYRIWSRIKIPSTSASTYQLEADNNTCWQVGGANVPVNVWIWVDWYGGNSSQKVNYTFTTTGNHTLKFIGAATNVQVDKVILLGSTEKCSDGGTTPNGDGANCASGPTATTTNPPVVTPPVIVTATTGQEVVEVKPNQAVTQGQLVSLDTSTVTDAVKVNTVQKVEFYDNEVLIETVSTPPFVLDTNKLGTGSHAVKQLTFFKDGTTSEQSQLIEIKGVQDVRSASATKNSSTQIIIGIGSLLALIVAAIIIFWYIRLRPQGYALRESIGLIARPFTALGNRIMPHKTSTTLHSDVDKGYYAEPTVVTPENKEK